MEWSNEQVMQFLDLYEQEPVIWNTSDKNNKNRNLVYDAWKRIEEKLGGTRSVSELKKKKESIMASFRVCHNKVKKSLRNRNGTAGVYQPTWFAYEKIASFLKDKDQPRGTIELVLAKKECEEYDLEDPSEDTSENDPLMEENFENEALIALPSTSKSHFGQTLKKRKMVSETDEVKAKKNATYSPIESHMQKRVRKKDICDIYGELVAEKLKNLDEHNRDVAMNKIDNILFQIKLNQNQLSNYHQPIPPNRTLTILTSPDYSQNISSPSISPST